MSASAPRSASAIPTSSPAASASALRSPARLAPEPEILLLDEPTSALDVSVQAEILNLLSDLRDEHELTFLMVSHNLSVVAHICSQSAVMKDGEIVELLTTEDLRRQTARHPYTRRLLLAAQGYVRDVEPEAAQ